MTAIRATYSDLKIVKTRKVIQLIFEVPIEEGDNALRVLGGLPRSDAETWVAIAPITEEAATRPTEKPRKAWDELPLPQQAGIRCDDVEFQQWLEAFDAQEAVEAVRRICGVKSRAEFATDEIAAERWRTLDHDFLARGIG